MVYIVLGKGFEEVEAVTPGDLLRRAGIETAYVGIDGLEVTGAHGIGVRADLTPEQMDLTRLDMIVLPGGLGGVASIRGCRQVMDAAPTILAELHITDGREAVCYPDPDLAGQMQASRFRPEAAVVQDGTVITGASAGCAIPLALALVQALKGVEVAQAVANQIVIR